MDKMIMKQLDRIEKSPGVYVFRDRKNRILYIGKAKNLRSRVRSYFIGSRDNRPLIPRIIDETAKISIIKTDSEVEAILFEAKLIKKNQPPYNARQKDDKSFVYVFINSSNPIPAVKFIREREMFQSVIPAKTGIQIRDRSRIKSRMTIKKRDKLFGPFLSTYEIKKLLNYFRQIIPFRDCGETKFKRCQKINRGCQWSEIEKCSAPCVSQSDIKEYRKNITKLSRLLSGKIKNVKKDFGREMRIFSKEKKFEQAAEARDRIKTLDHIKTVSMIDDHTHLRGYTYEVEAVDISNTSGRYASGAIVAAEYQKSNLSRTELRDIKFLKERYRRFKIKLTNKPDDVSMMKEVIKRRFNHSEWKFPDLLIIDGGRGQLRAVESGLKNSSRPPAAASNGKKINLVAIAKGPKRKGEKLFFSRNFDSKLKSTLIKDKRVIKLMRDEAHRFAISYHKILRRKGIIGQ